MKSIWNETIKMPERRPLNGRRCAEVAVIGAGLTGILTAYFLQKQGKQVVVFEADRIGSGQTGNTTAKITIQHGHIYSYLLGKYGQECARLYAEAGTKAIEQYADLIREEKIDCHFTWEKSYLYAGKDVDKLEKEMEAVTKTGIPVTFLNHTDLPFAVRRAICFDNQAQFHPLEFLFHLSQKLRVYEKTKVLKVHGHRIVTNRGELCAKHIVFAAHYPFSIVPGFYFMRQHQQRSYVIGIKGVPKWEGMYYSEGKDGLSFRWHEDILLVGGGAHRTGQLKGNQGYAFLEAKIRELFPQAKVVYRWSAQDCMTHDKLPFIGRYSLLRPYWYVATGYKKWGMTQAMVAANLICDRICGKENPYQKIFSPQRLHPCASFFPFLEDAGISMLGFIKGLPLLLIQGKHTKRCPHMGCAMNDNPQEGVWECACHGSRFSRGGEILDGPAQCGLKQK